MGQCCGDNLASEDRFLPVSFEREPAAGGPPTWERLASAKTNPVVPIAKWHPKRIDLGLRF